MRNSHWDLIKNSNHQLWFGQGGLRNPIGNTPWVRTQVVVNSVSSRISLSQTIRCERPSSSVTKTKYVSLYNITDNFQAGSSISQIFFLLANTRFVTQITLRLGKKWGGGVLIGSWTCIRLSWIQELKLYQESLLPSVDSFFLCIGSDDLCPSGDKRVTSMSRLSTYQLSNLRERKASLFQ